MPKPNGAAEPQGETLAESSTSTLSRNQKKKLRKRLGRVRAIELKEAQQLDGNEGGNPAKKARTEQRADQEDTSECVAGASSQVSTQASLAACGRGVGDTETHTEQVDIDVWNNELPCTMVELHEMLLRQYQVAEETDGSRLLPTMTATAAMTHPPVTPTVKEESAAGSRGKFAPYGNYHRYYGYRLGQAFDADPRLALLERPWFARRRCMDVGCNEGVVTLAIAQRFACQSMVGVDIDAALITRACTSLRTLRTAAVTRSASARAKGVDPGERRSARDALRALSQTWFVHADFLESAAAKGSLDTITCFSVTKWIHLHRGDMGMVALFQRFWQLLAPGGVLILEPQPWSSYKTAHTKLKKQRAKQHDTGVSFRLLSDLRLRPEAFPSFLCDTLGFRLLRRLQPNEAASGFSRPILVLRRP